MDDLVPATIDTLGIAFHISDFDQLGCDVQITNYGLGSEGLRYRRKLPGGGFVATGAGGQAWVEASLPKRVDPLASNVRALPVREALAAVEALYHEACDFVQPLEDMGGIDGAKVVRLDLVRDFSAVGDVGSVLDGLAMVEQPGRSKVRRFADPSRGAAETLRVGPRAWGCQLYDKYVETRGDAPAGSLRFETRLHQEQLRSVFAREHGGHFRTVEDLLREDSLAVAQRAWFSRVGFDRSIVAGSALSSMIADAGLSSRESAALWSYLTCAGFASSLHRNSRRKYRNLAAGLGVAPCYLDGGAGTGSAAPAALIRLGYVEGTVLAA